MYPTRITILAAIGLTLAAATSSAEEFVCETGNEKRLISVEYEHKGWSVPCRVRYEKPAEDVVEYPWNAAATPGYCEEKAAFLAGKLEKWGWVCTRTDTDETESGS